jgi:hypothetical protein
MPPRSKLDLLPDEIRQELTRKLIANAFGKYEEIAEWLGTQGCEIRKSALHDYGQRLRKLIERQSRTTRAAEALMAEAPDEQAARSAAIIATAETDLFDLLADLQETDELSVPERLKLLSQVSRASADLSRAGISVGRYRHEVEARVKAAEDKVSKIATKGGIAPAQSEAIRAAIREIVG